MKIYYLRHQAAGVISESPFTSPPTPEQLAPLIEKIRKKFERPDEGDDGTKHPKTKKPYLMKIIEVDTDKPGEDPVTVGGVNGESAAEIDALAAGACPIRDSGRKRSLEAEEQEAEFRKKFPNAKGRASSGEMKVIGSGEGTVRNP